MSDPALDNALRLRRAGRLAEAAEIYSQILRANPKHFEALHSLGILRYQSGQIDEAERLIGAAIAVDPRAADAIYNRACLLQKLGRTADSLASFGDAIAARPGYVEALTNRGGVLMQLQRYADAKADFDAVLAQAPSLPQAWNNAGSASTKLRRYDEALARFDKALALRPDYAEAWKNRGLAFLLQGGLERAVADFDKAISLDPRYAEAWQHRGDAVAYFDPVQAVANYDRALLLRPDHAETIFRRASALLALRRFEEASAGFRSVLERDPQYEYARGALLFCRQSCCDWTSRDDELTKLQSDLKADRVALAPFASLSLLNDPSDMKAVARRFVAKQYAPQEPSRITASNHDRVRVAYLSANFNDHAVARLIAGVFERHDKSRFETVGIGFGAAKGEMHARIGRAFDHFFDVRTKSDREVAQLIAEMEVDIAVDLMGFTQHCRLGILAFRPAPLQVNYLGFPGTIGADYIDYIIADPFVLKDEQRSDFTEQVVYLPHCYLPNDAGRRMPETAPTRSQAGLPEAGFVFCSFNQTYKFTPDLFDIWMRLLRAISGSVLWLPTCAPAAMQNLKREAEARGVAGQRLVFAPFAGTVEDHLSRLRLADLFLDTLPYNSHTSTCDALFAGVPLVTCPGATFAGRVAASALLAHGVPDLIAGSLADYEALALSIARDLQKTAALKAKIARHRHTHALFDTALFTRNLERAYIGMWQRHQRGEPPRCFSVEPEMRPFA